MNIQSRVLPMLVARDDFVKLTGKILLVLVVLEAALGGGGRLIDTGLVSPRMVLFGVALAYAVFRIGVAQAPIPWEFACLICAFCALLLFNGSISLVSNVPLQAIMEDAKPQLYFAMLAFFAITIRNARDVATVTGILKFSAVVLSIAYLGVLLLWHCGVFTFQELQGALNPTADAGSEFFFRGETTFFFKAVLYVGVGLFLFLSRPSLWGKLGIILTTAALALTLTRGLAAALCLSLAAWFLFFYPDRIRGIAYAGTNVLLAGVAVLVISLLSPTAAESVALRTADLRQLTQTWDLSALLIGQGLGGALGARGHVEMNYVEILYKQGLLGLVFWFLPIAYLTLQLPKLTTAESRGKAIPYYLAALFVYFENATNAFLTNPIGMSVVLIAMAAIRALRREPGLPADRLVAHGAAPLN